MSPTNEDRAEWAGEALDTFADRTFGGRSFSTLHPEDQADCFADLLCNLRHFAAQNGFDFADLDRRGQGNYEYESDPDYQGD